jgi:uncharacterized protein (DUF58 family)
MKARNRFLAFMRRGDRALRGGRGQSRPMISKDILAQVKKLEIQTNRIINSTVSGEYQSAFRGLGIEFQEVRPYQIGDDIKFIDWNVTARTGTPHVKIFREERELHIYLLVDMSASQDFGTRTETKKDLALKIAALLALTALKNNDRVGLLLFTNVVEKFIPAKKGKKHVLRLLREIVSFTPEGRTTNIKAALEHINLVTKRKSAVFLLSDYIGSDYQKTFEITAHKHDLIPILIRDNFEADVLPFGYLRLRDLEKGQELIVDTRNKNFRTEYKKAFLKELSTLKDLFLKNTGDFIQLTGSEPYLEKIISFFKRRTLRKRY